MITLLQVNTELTGAAAEAAKELDDKNMLDVIIDGGWAMIPLGILLIAAIYIFFERYLTLRKSNADSEDFMKQVRGYVSKGNLDGAKGLCESRNDPFARMIHKGISRLGTSSIQDIEKSIETVGKLEIIRLERRLPLLATIAGAGPMIGFMGTVLGMIDAFNQIVRTGGNASAQDLAGGISTAMITTASGLIVGVLAYLAYNSLVSMVNKVVFKLELTASDFLDLLQEPAS